MTEPGELCHDLILWILTKTEFSMDKNLCMRMVIKTVGPNPLPGIAPLRYINP